MNELGSDFERAGTLDGSYLMARHEALLSEINRLSVGMQADIFELVQRVKPEGVEGYSLADLMIVMGAVAGSLVAAAEANGPLALGPAGGSEAEVAGYAKVLSVAMKIGHDAALDRHETEPLALVHVGEEGWREKAMQDLATREAMDKAGPVAGRA